VHVLLNHLEWSEVAGVLARAPCLPLCAADAVFQRLEAGAAVADQHLYSRDARGVWMRRAGQNSTAAYSKYCTTCNIWYVRSLAAGAWCGTTS
jgi:hypothetical protein